MGIPGLLDMHIEDKKFYEFNSTFLAINHRELCEDIELEVAALSVGNENIKMLYGVMSSVIRCVMFKVSNGDKKYEMSTFKQEFTVDGLIALRDNKQIDIRYRAGVDSFLKHCGHLPARENCHIIDQPFRCEPSVKTIERVEWFKNKVHERLNWFSDIHEIMNAR